MSKNRQNLIEYYNNLQTTIKKLEEKIKSFDKEHQILGSVYLENLKNASSLLRPSFIQMVNSSNSEEAANTQIFEANYCNIKPMIDHNLNNFIKVKEVYLDLKKYSTPITLKHIKSHSVDLTSNKALVEQLAQESELKELEQRKSQCGDREKRVLGEEITEQESRNLLDKLEAAIVSLELANQNQRMLLPQTQNKTAPMPPLPLILEGKNHLGQQKINLEKTGKILKPVETQKLATGIFKTAQLILYETTRLLNLEQEFVIPKLLSMDIVMAGEESFQSLDQVGGFVFT